MNTRIPERVEIIGFIKWSPQNCPTDCFLLHVSERQCMETLFRHQTRPLFPERTCQDVVAAFCALADSTTATRGCVMISSCLFACCAPKLKSSSLIPKVSSAHMEEREQLTHTHIHTDTLRRVFEDLSSTVGIENRKKSNHCVFALKIGLNMSMFVCCKGDPGLPGPIGVTGPVVSHSVVIFLLSDDTNTH